MENAPRLSIVTPAYNAATYIGAAIQSVLSQDYANLEYTVVDGGSNDGTIDILRKFESDSRYEGRFSWISERDSGQTDAINKGLRKSSGQWFAFLNADDCYHKHAFAKIGSYLVRYSDAGVIYGNCTMHYGGCDAGPEFLRKPPTRIAFKDLLYGNRIYGPASFYSMAALRKVGEFDASLHHWMDWEMYLRIARVMRMQYVDLDIAMFRICEGQKTPFVPTLRNREAYKVFHQEAHSVSTRYGGAGCSRLLLKRSHAVGLLVRQLNCIAEKILPCSRRVSSRGPASERQFN